MKKNRFDFLIPAFLKNSEEISPALVDEPLHTTEPEEVLSASDNPDLRPTANYGGFSPGFGLNMSISFTGEKSQGGIGPIIDYKMDHRSLAMRAWQLFLESDDCQIVISKYAIWAIGNGLKLQAEPKRLVLESEGIDDELNGFSEIAEARFALFCDSTFSSYNGVQSLHELAEDGFITSNLSGNTVVVIRYIDNMPKVQLIDGIHLCNPSVLELGPNGIINPGTRNRIVNGVELNERGEHVAFHIRKGLIETERIEAKIGKYNLVQAFLIKGKKYKIDTVLGIPSITSVMETAKKLERYTQAALSTAEERAKVSLVIEHDLNGTGENPMAGAIAEANGYSSVESDLAFDQRGEKLRSTVAATTEKQVVNLTQGAKLKTIESDTDLNFKDFANVHSDKIAATMTIPPNVAAGKYDTSYSSSRAAAKDWEHTLSITRKRFSRFYQYIYQYWLFVEIHKGKIKAPGYLKALGENNVMALAAFHNARWEGANVPHIDPLKEVLAQREAMGILGKFFPLATGEYSTEALSNGDFKENMNQFVNELGAFKKAMEAAGIQMPSFDSPATGKTAESEREGKTAE